MFISKFSLFGLALASLSSQCTAIYRLRSTPSKAKVNQVLYLQDGDNTSVARGIEVPAESIPIVTSENRDLSFWSSIMNFVRCPPGFHDDNNPHCHQRHHNGGTHPSSGGESGGGDGGGGGEDDDQNHNYSASPTLTPSPSHPPSPSPTIFEDNISNDHSCWWCGRGQRNNSSSSQGMFSNGSGTRTSRSMVYTAVSLVGGVAIISVFLKKRYDNTPTTTSEDHLLDGAVSQRKKKLVSLLKKSKIETSVTFRPDPTSPIDSIGQTVSTDSTEHIDTSDVTERKGRNPFTRIFKRGKQSKHKLDIVPVETPGSYYVKA